MSRTSLIRLGVLALLGASALAHVGTPDSLASLPSIAERLQEGATLALAPPVLRTVLERVVLFVPLGVLAAWLFPAQATRRRWWIAALGVAAFAALLELLQAAVPGRHPRLGDFLLAALAAGVAARLAVVPPAALLAAAPRIGAGLALAGGVFIVALFADGARFSNLSRWDCTFHLNIGDEAVGGRAWRGRLDEVRLYDHATGPSPTRAPLARYSFDRPAPLSEGVAGLSADGLRSVGAEGWSVRDGALVIDAPSHLQSDGDFERVCTRLRRTNAFTLVVEGVTPDLGQEGPARIVALSADTRRQSFLLGQEYGALEFRVRTPDPDRALSYLYSRNFAALQSPAVLEAGAPFTAAASYDRGLARLCVGGACRSFDLADRVLISEGGRAVSRAALATAAFLLAGAGAFLARRGRLDAVLWAAGLGLAVSAASAAAMVIVDGRFTMTMVMTALACPAGAILARAGQIAWAAGGKHVATRLGLMFQ